MPSGKAKRPTSIVNSAQERQDIERDAGWRANSKGAQFVGVPDHTNPPHVALIYLQGD